MFAKSQKNPALCCVVCALAFAAHCLAWQAQSLASTDAPAEGKVDVRETIRKHAEAMEAIAKYHLKYSLYVSSTVDGNVKLSRAKVEECEIWRSGNQRRQRQRFLYQGGAPSKAPHGKMIERSTDANQALTLEGWDPDRPPTVPIEYGRNAKEYFDVVGGINVRDPLVIESQTEAYALLLNIVPTLTLAEALEVCDITQLPGIHSSTPIVRLSINSSTDARLRNGIQFPIFVDIDTACGYMIRRLEILRAEGSDANNEFTKVVGEAEDFDKIAPGLFAPIAARRTTTIAHLKSEVVREYEIEMFALNPKMEPDDLRVRFPEGCKVIESPDYTLHVWGKDGPLRTFTDNSEFREYMFARARDYQAAGNAASSNAAGTERRVNGQTRYSWLIGANLALIAALVALYTIRKRLG